MSDEFTIPPEQVAARSAVKTKKLRCYAPLPYMWIEALKGCASEGFSFGRRRRILMAMAHVEVTPDIAANLPPRSPAWRSRITNGSKLLDGIVDRRSARYRRYRDLQELLIEDAGGEAKLTFAGKEAVKMAAAMIVEGKAFQTAIVNNTPIDQEPFICLANAVIRCFASSAPARTPGTSR